MPRRSAAFVGTAPITAAQAPVLDARARLQWMFQTHHNVVWRTLRRFGLDEEAAADVAQQAFLVAIERVDDIWSGSERAFLVGTALRLARSQRRGAARLRLDEHVEQRLVQPPAAESRVTTLQLLDRILGELDAELVEVFVLFDVEGLGAAEIAQALGIPTGTVASRLRRAREAFRALARRYQAVFAREGRSP